MANSITIEIAVASPAPKTPSFGEPKCPKIRVSPQDVRQVHHDRELIIGVRVSPAARIAAVMLTLAMRNGNTRRIGWKYGIT